MRYRIIFKGSCLPKEIECDQITHQSNGIMFLKLTGEIHECAEIKLPQSDVVLLIANTEYAMIEKMLDD